MLGDLKKIIFAFADEVQFQQIVRKCRLNNQIRALFPVIEAIMFRKICNPDIGYIPNEYIIHVIWYQGIQYCRNHRVLETFLLQKRIQKFPSL